MHDPDTSKVELVSVARPQRSAASQVTAPASVVSLLSQGLETASEEVRVVRGVAIDMVGLRHRLPALRVGFVRRRLLCANTPQENRDGQANGDQQLENPIQCWPLSLVER